jgi:multiple sugar transport system substrate-binding protein
MMEKEQFDPWLTAAGGYIAQPLAAYQEQLFGLQIPSTHPIAIASKTCAPLAMQAN